MATITINEAKLKAQNLKGAYRSTFEALNETVQKQRTDKMYTIFLSHARVDSDIILGVKGIIEELGYSIYIDWVDDPHLDRTNVTAETAATLRLRMDACGCLFYATTQSSTSSKWMPWEAGYFDGKRQRTAILPVTQYSTDTFQGQEYLGLYPYITKARREGDGKQCLWVHRTADLYVGFEAWLKEGGEPRRH